MARANTKQLTLHFAGEQAKILDTIKDAAKKAFRTTEQQVLFMLNNMLLPPDFVKEPFDPAELLDQPAELLDQPPADAEVTAEELDEAFSGDGEQKKEVA